MNGTVILEQCLLIIVQKFSAHLLGKIVFGPLLARVPLQNLVMKFFPEISPVLLCRPMGT